MHNIGKIYRTKIKQLTNGLDDPAIRLKAIETIQSVIDHIKVTPTNTGFDVELHDELGAIMEVEGFCRKVSLGFSITLDLSYVFQKLQAGHH